MHSITLAWPRWLSPGKSLIHLNKPSVRSFVMRYFIWRLLFVIQDGADHRRACFHGKLSSDFSHYLRVSEFGVLILYFRVYVVTSCVWSTIQCQGSDSHRGLCIRTHCLDLGDYPRVSRKFLKTHAYRVRSFVMWYFVTYDSLSWLLFVIQDGADHRRACFRWLSITDC